MPAILGVVAAAAASWGVGAALGAATIGGISLAASLGGFGVALIQGAVGLIVSMAFSAITRPKTKSQLSSSAADRKQTIRGGTISRRVIYGRARVGGVIAFTTSSGADKEYMDIVLLVAGHPCDGIEGVWINDTWVPVQAFGNGVGTDLLDHVSVRWWDGTQTIADPVLVSQTGGEWGNGMVLRGIAYVYLRLKYSQDKYPSGFSSFSALVRGKRVLDTRTNVTAWTTNPAMIVRDYLLDQDSGLGAQPTEIDEGWFMVAANVCDEAVQLNAEATSFQKRYECDYAFTLDQKPVDVMDDMLTSCLGTLVYVQGQYRLHPGAYVPPAVTLTPSDFASEITVQTRPQISGLFNAVKGTFINPERGWEASEFPEVTSGTYEGEDGQRLYVDIELSATNDPTRAQRLATQKLRRAREAVAIKGTLKYGAVRFSAWDSVALEWPDLGWDGKVFRLSAWRFDPITGLIEVELTEDAPQSYAWVYDAAWAMPPSPNTNLVNPLSIPVPTNVLLTPTTTLNRDGAAVPAMLATWTASPHPFVTAHEVQWTNNLAVPTPVWDSAEVPAGTNRYLISPAVVGWGYAIRVRAIAGLVRSAWSGYAHGVGAPDTTAPGPCTGLIASGGLRLITLRWYNPGDPDLDRVEVEEYNPGSPQTDWYLIGQSRTNFFVRGELAPDVGLYHRVRAVDRSGNYGPYSELVYAVPQRAVTNDVAANQISDTFAVYGGAAETAGLWVYTDGSPILVQARALMTGDRWTTVVGETDVTYVSSITCVLRRNYQHIQSAVANGAPITAAFGIKEVLGGGWHLYDVVITDRQPGSVMPTVAQIAIVATVLKR